MKREHDISSSKIIPQFLISRLCHLLILSIANFQLALGYMIVTPLLHHHYLLVDLPISNHCSNDSVVPNTSDGSFTKSPSALASPHPSVLVPLNPPLIQWSPLVVALLWTIPSIQVPPSLLTQQSP